ncbi:hypothetical protein F5877DRAFT_83888 [Lentinula edodes]|nr:hypothetical protein F5877DRAFT_83888 [Lentinula edodes]
MQYIPTRRYFELLALHNALLRSEDIAVSLPFVPSAWLEDVLTEGRKSGPVTYLNAILVHATYRNGPAMSDFLPLNESKTSNSNLDLEDGLPWTLDKATAIKGEMKVDATLIDEMYYPDWSESELYEVLNSILCLLSHSFPSPASATTSLFHTGTSASGIEISGTDDDEGPVVIPPGRDRSGTVVARANWDPIGQQWRNIAASLDTAQSSPTPSVSPNDQSRPSSRPQSKTEDDADVDMDGPIRNSASTKASVSAIDAPSPRTSRPHQQTHRPSMNRHTLVGLGLAGDPVPPLNMTMGGLAGIGHGDAHIVINDSAGGADGLGTMGDIGMNMGLGGGMAGEDRIVSGNRK